MVTFPMNRHRLEITKMVAENRLEGLLNGRLGVLRPLPNFIRDGGRRVQLTTPTEFDDELDFGGPLPIVNYAAAQQQEPVQQPEPAAQQEESADRPRLQRQNAMPPPPSTLARNE